MRNLIAPAALAFSLVIGSAAFAAPPPAASTPAQPAATAKPATPPAKPSTADKRAACEKAWKAQKTHTSDEASFVKACVAKG